MGETLALHNDTYTPLIEMVITSLHSPHSRRAYTRALVTFLEWHTEQGRPLLNKLTVQRYCDYLKRYSGAATINLHLAAVKKLVREAVDNGLLDHTLLAGIENVTGVKREGQRTGNWLAKEQAATLLTAPDPTTHKGIRDRALLAVAVGCGLRRSEIIALTFTHIQQREGRWVIVDIIGKRGRMRSVPMPAWAKDAIDRYSNTLNICNGYVFRPLHRSGKIVGDQLSVQTVLDIVREYAIPLGWGDLAPHDLRRTFAKLARKGGAALDQIQHSLGHSSVETTQRYIGDNQSFTDAPADYLGIRF